MNVNHPESRFRRAAIFFASLRPAILLLCISIVGVTTSPLAAQTPAQLPPEMHSVLEVPNQIAESNPAAPAIVAPARVDDTFQFPAIDDTPVPTTDYELRESEFAAPRIPQNSIAEPTADEPEVLAEAPQANIDIDRLLTRLVLESMPHTYDKDKDWGKQVERFDGLEVERDGLRIETRRKKKLVNHGTWRRYSAQLVNPAEEFSVRVTNLHKTESGNTGFDVHFTANLNLQARQSKWVKGVQLYSVSAEGHARIRLVVSCEMGVQTSFRSFPPDLIFTPVANSAEIIVDEFRIDRVSKLGGEFAQQLSRRARRELDKKIESQEKKLVKKINKELEENQDKLRLSIADAVKSRWAEPAKAFLPTPVQDAIDAAKK